MRHPTTSLAVAAAALIAIALTGCGTGSTDAQTPSAAPEQPASASPAPSPAPDADSEGGDQTVAEACDVIEQPFIQVGQDITDANEGASDSPEVLTDAFRAASDDLTTLSESLENAEVQSTVDTAIASLDNVTIAFEAAIADPTEDTLAEFQSTLEGVTADFAAIDTLCS